LFLIKGMLPRPTGRKARPFWDARTMVEAIVYQCRCGIAWRDLPEVFGPWQRVWTWHHRMARDSTEAAAGRGAWTRQLSDTLWCGASDDQTSAVDS
jgi:transposase